MSATDLDPTTDPWARRMAVVLFQRWGRRVNDLRLALDGDGLVLRGRAPTYYVKQLAQHAAAEACGLPVRANEIEVADRDGPHGPETDPHFPAGDEL